MAVEKIVASIDVGLGADERVGAPVNEIDATNKKVDASIARVGAAEKNGAWSNELVQRPEILSTRRPKIITRRAHVNSRRTK